MSPDFVVEVAQKAMWTAVLVTLPALAAGMVVGVLVSVLMAVTQVNEITLGFIPKMAAIVSALIFSTPWMLRHLMEFARTLLSDFPFLIR